MNKRERPAQVPTPSGAGIRREGHPISLLKLREDPSTESNAVTLNLNMSEAPIPERRYVADVCMLKTGEDGVRFVFGQRDLEDQGLDSALVVRMNPQAARDLSDSLNSMTEPTLEQIMEVMRIKGSPLLSAAGKPRQMVSLMSNICSVAVSGYEVCMDFYHASAFAFRVTTGQKLDVEPVVRVDIPTSLFSSLRAALTNYTAESRLSEG